MIKRRILFFGLIALSFAALAALPVKTFHFKDNFPKALDLDAVKSPSSLNNLAKAKWYENNQEWQKCLDTIENESRSGSIALWVSVTHLNCLKSVYETNGKISAQKLIQSFKNIEKNKFDVLHSPFYGHRKLVVQVFLDLGEIALTRGRDEFDDFMSRNHDLADSFEERERAKYYKLMGEMAWLRQKNDLAKSNFLRSYSFREDRSVLARLESLDALKYLKLNKYRENVNFSEKETEAWNQFSAASDKGQTIKVAKDGVQFLSDFPGSKRASEVSDRISLFFKRLLYRREAKYTSLKESFESYMLKAPPENIYNWADVAFQRGYYESSLKLADKAFKGWEDRADAAKALIIAARSSYYLGKLSDSEDYLKVLIEKHSGHESSYEAQYLQGLLFYRKGSYEKVVHLYDQFLLDPGSDLWELQVRYWLWRAMKKINSPRANEVGETILKEFPLTYYGLIVRMESKGSLQDLMKEEMKDITSSYWWTISNDSRWDRVTKLLQNGWLIEAEKEMDMLPNPQLGEDFVVRAKFWQSAHNTRRSMKDFSDAIDKDLNYLTKSLLEMTFPKEYTSEVEAAHKEFSISQELIWSIIRQESAFSPRAVSPSNAYGLMQLLKPTMQETANWLRVKNFRLSRDIYDPKMNVRFGTHFLSRMIRKYRGVVPLAIASYNVGPGNLDRWLNQRVDLQDWPEYGNNPDNDMWMDELPWAETSFYVKAVMRNFLLYRIIHNGYNQLETPTWSGAQEAYKSSPES